MDSTSGIKDGNSSEESFSSVKNSFKKLDERKGIAESGIGRRFSTYIPYTPGFRMLSFNDDFFTIACNKFHGKQRYMDLGGRFVEQHLKRRIEDGDLPYICSYLKANKDIIYLNLSYNSITSTGFSFLARYLADDKQIKGLNLVHNNITSIYESVVRKTSPLWNVKCLVLTGNKFGKEGGIQIANILRFNTSITHLEIGETDQTIQSISHIIESLISYLGGNNTLQKIDLTRMVPSSSNKRMDSSHFCRLFSNVFIHNSFLLEIHITKNEITDSDLEIMSEALKRNKVLQLINLNANRLTSYGLEFLANILPETSIISLMVSSNRIDDVGATALGRVFSKTKLQFLDISYNKIRDIGFVNLIWGMKAQRPPVDTFFFYGNPISMFTADILQLQVFLGHITPNSMDVLFICRDNKLLLVEDKTANKYRNLHYFVHDFSRAGGRIHQSCCYDPSAKRKLINPLFDPEDVQYDST